MHIHSWAQQLRGAKHSLILIKGGRASTKSTEVAQWLVERMTQEPLRILLAREYAKDLQLSGIMLMNDIIWREGLQKRFSSTGGGLRNRDTGAQCFFRGISRNPNSLRSMEGIDLCWVEEAHSISDTAMRTLSPTVRKNGAQMLATWNPMTPDDPVSKFWDFAPNDTTLKIETNWAQNHFLSQRTFDDMRMYRNRSLSLFNHIYNGYYIPVSEFTPFGQSYIDAAVHRPLDRPKGAARNPFVCVGIDVAYTSGEESDWTAFFKVDEYGNEIDCWQGRVQNHHERVQLAAEFCRDANQIFIDTTESGGRILRDDLAAQHNIAAYGYHFSNPSKDHLVVQAAARLRNGTCAFRNPILRSQLLMWTRHPVSKKNGPEHGHSDMACAWLLAMEVSRLNHPNMV